MTRSIICKNKRVTFGLQYIKFWEKDMEEITAIASILPYEDHSFVQTLHYVLNDDDITLKKAAEALQRNLKCVRNKVWTAGMDSALSALMLQREPRQFEDFRQACILAPTASLSEEEASRKKAIVPILEKAEVLNFKCEEILRQIFDCDNDDFSMEKAKDALWALFNAYYDQSDIDADWLRLFNTSVFILV